MANKKITDLTLRSSVEDIVNFPSDDGTQSWRVTAAQIFDYIVSKLTDVITTAMLQANSVTAAKLAADVTSLLNPTGIVLPFAGLEASIPSGWLACYGQSLLRADYATLFGIIGTTYGSADGTHFNIPDLRGRVIAGQDDMGGSSANRLTGLTGGINGDNLGAVGGAESHTLTTAQMAHNHTYSGTTSLPGSGTSVGAQGSDDNGYHHTHTYSGTVSAVANNTATAHNNVQPTIILNYIIKT